MTGISAIEPDPLPGEVFKDLPSRIRSHAVERPDEIALIDSEKRMTFGELADQMDRFAALLRKEGVQPGSVVGTLAGLTAEHLLAYLGIVAAGAAIAPLPFTASKDALARMIGNSGAALVLGDGNAPSGFGARSLDDFVSWASEIEPQAPQPLTPTVLFDILYSSGTTGAPKGIEHDARFRDRQIMRLAGLGYGPEAVHLAATPVYSNTTLAALLPALGQGARVVLQRKFNEEEYLQLAEKERVTHTMLVPVQYKRLLEHPKFEYYDLSTFRAKLSTSAPFAAGVLQDILDRWPGKMINIYGMTEGGLSTLLDCTEYPDKLHTVGKPALGGRFKILRDDGSEAGPKEVGEIVGRSPTMMRGYRSAQKETDAATWISSEGEIFIRTGDIGMVDEDGFVIVKDRKKDVIISGGFNIFASDLEAVLSDHPAVAEAAVVGIPSDRWGETPVAAVVLCGDAAEPALKEWANARLGKTQRLADVKILDALPRNSIGKVLKRELRDTWGAQA